MRTLEDLSFNVFQNYYNRYELSELTYPIRRRLFGPSKKKFDEVMKEFKCLANIENDFLLIELSNRYDSSWYMKPPRQKIIKIFYYSDLSKYINIVKK